MMMLLYYAKLHALFFFADVTNLTDKFDINKSNQKYFDASQLFMHTKIILNKRKSILR